MGKKRRREFMSGWNILNERRRERQQEERERKDKGVGLDIIDYVGEKQI